MTFTALRSSFCIVAFSIVPLAACGGGGGGTTGVFTGAGTVTGIGSNGNGTGKSTTTGSSSSTSGGTHGATTGANGTSAGVTGTSGVGSTTSGSTSGNCGAGLSCTPANICDVGLTVCNGGVASCSDQGPSAAQNGVTCNGSGGVCDNGSCVACNQGTSCQPSNVCDLGSLDCSTGVGICDDTGNANSNADGDSCGNGGFCDEGTCVTCNQGASCQPSNICDLGSIDCSGGGNGVCDDQGPDSSQNGTICAQGKTCDNGACVSAGGTTGSSSTTGGTSGSTNWPLVTDQGQPTVANPHLVYMTYSDDPNLAFLEQYGVWISDGGYLPAVAGQYGVGNATIQFVNLGSSSTAPTGTNTNQNAFPDYLQGLFDADTIPAYAANNLYVLILPSTWADTTTFCQTQGGYHTYFQDNDGNFPLYAIIPNCPSAGSAEAALQFEQQAISHEVVEGTTDPLIESYQIQDMNNPWYYLGGEVGDLCASNNNFYTSTNGDYVAQLIWSNEAVSANEVPCQPWTASQTYYSLIGPSTMATASPGGTAVVTITGWTNTSGAGNFGVFATDGDYGTSFSTTPLLSSSTISDGTTVTVTLNVPSNASTGEAGAAWILAYDLNTGVYYGSTMAGVVVQ